MKMKFNKKIFKSHNYNILYINGEDVIKKKIFKYIIIG